MCGAVHLGTRKADEKNAFETPLLFETPLYVARMCEVATSLESESTFKKSNTCGGYQRPDFTFTLVSSVL